VRVLSLLAVIGIALVTLTSARAEGVVSAEEPLPSANASVQVRRASGAASVYLPIFGNRRHAELLLVGEYTLGESGWAARSRLGVVASDAGLYGLKLSYELIENRLRAAGIYFDSGDFSAGLELVAVQRAF